MVLCKEISFIIVIGRDFITVITIVFFATFCILCYSDHIVHISPVVPASKSYTVAIIKPDAVAHGKANEIIMKVHGG